MNTSDQIAFLEDKIKEYISLYDRKRQRNKFLSLAIKLISAALAAAITIVLGITFKDKPDNAYKNVALIFGASITIISTWDAFFNHKALWIRFTIAMSKLYALQNDISYLKTKSIEQVSEAKLDSIYDELKKIILDTNSNWEELRKEENSQGTK
jgi:hypothetical protein